MLKLLAGILSLLQSAPHIVSMRAFAPLFTGKPSALNVRNLVAHSPRFQALVQSINMTVTEDFAAAAEYVTVFESIRMIDDHRKTWNADAYAAEAAGSARKVNLDLRKFRTWKAELDKMKVSQVCSVGHCLINKTPLQASCRSYKGCRGFVCPHIVLAKSLKLLSICSVVRSCLR